MVCVIMIFSHAPKKWEVAHLFCVNQPHQCLTVENVLFNNVERDPMSLTNFVILVIKNTIYVNKCLDRECSVKEIKEKVELARKCELYNAKQKNKCALHYKKWYGIEPSGNVNPNDTRGINEEYLYDITIH